MEGDKILGLDDESRLHEDVVRDVARKKGCYVFYC